MRCRESLRASLRRPEAGCARGAGLPDEPRPGPPRIVVHYSQKEKGKKQKDQGLRWSPGGFPMRRTAGGAPPRRTAGRRTASYRGGAFAVPIPCVMRDVSCVVRVPPRVLSTRGQQANGQKKLGPGALCHRAEGIWEGGMGAPRTPQERKSEAGGPACGGRGTYCSWSQRWRGGAPGRAAGCASGAAGWQGGLRAWATSSLSPRVSTHG